MLSESQRSELKFSIPVLQHVSLQGTTVLADKGYNDDNRVFFKHALTILPFFSIVIQFIR